MKLLRCATYSIVVLSALIGCKGPRSTEFSDSRILNHISLSKLAGRYEAKWVTEEGDSGRALFNIENNGSFKGEEEENGHDGKGVLAGTINEDGEISGTCKYDGSPEDRISGSVGTVVNGKIVFKVKFIHPSRTVKQIYYLNQLIKG